MQEGHHVTNIQDLVGTEAQDNIKNDRERGDFEPVSRFADFDSPPRQDPFQLFVRLVYVSDKVKPLHGIVAQPGGQSLSDQSGRSPA
jgi:hypothetical protein